MPKDYQAIDQSDTEQESNSFFQKVKYFIFIILTIPFIIYIFIILPTQETSRVELPKLIKNLNLTNDLIANPNQRLILIGDVHGCLKPLESLLSKLNYNVENDQVILLGDYISKGPDSIGVLDYAIEQGLKGILGNHELSILAKYSGLKTLEFKDDENDYYEWIPKQTNGKKFDKEISIARKLTPEHINYITSMPLFLGLGPVASFKNHQDVWNQPYNGIATHLGMDPHLTIEEQKIMDLLAIDKSWYKGYNDYEKTIGKNHRNIIYYGHHASLGLNLNKYTKGLDSGCVYGGELTASVIYTEKPEHGELIYKEDIISIKC